jgi:hypothetical protein
MPIRDLLLRVLLTCASAAQLLLLLLCTLSLLHEALSMLHEAESECGCGDVPQGD